MAKSKKRVAKSTSTETRTRRVEAVEDGNGPLIKKIAIIVLVLAGLYLLLNFISDSRGDQDDATTNGDDTSQVEESDDAPETKDEAPAAESNGTSVTETDEEFSYTVGGGESYTTMARRAVIGIDSDLTTAERVAAETKIVTDASAEWLNEGQDLVLSKDTVRAAVDWAKSLSEAEKAAWQPYADLIAW